MLLILKSRQPCTATLCPGIRCATSGLRSLLPACYRSHGLRGNVIQARKAMLLLLRSWGCDCVAAESIEEALDQARLFTPELVICDYRLREQRTGLEAITALRDVFGASLPALLITGDTAPDRLREAQSSGIPLLQKPVSACHLYNMLLKILP